jgi:hypothetical protein
MSNTLAELERKLRSGADPNERDAAGSTALHRAVASGQAAEAACLLAHGADPHAADSIGRSPFDPGLVPIETLHAIRQHYQRYRTMEGDPAARLPAPLRAIAAELAARGIVRLPGFVAPAALEGMRNGLRAFVAEVDALLARGLGVYHHYDEELHWAPKYQAYFGNNAFKYSPDLVRMCFSHELLALVDSFLGKPSFVSRGVATRYLPMEAPNGNAFIWHHDMEEKRLKAMVLLTDVSIEDQPMSFVAGSHTIFHPYEMFLRNDCSLDYCLQHLSGIEEVHTVGQAGDVFLFDSNGAHRGTRRKEGAMRDAYFVEFATNSAQVWGSDLDAALVRELGSKTGVNPFSLMQVAEKKWDQAFVRTATGWVETLPRVESWL